jgi:hypothetical protein
MKQNTHQFTFDPFQVLFVNIGRNCFLKSALGVCGLQLYRELRRVSRSAQVRAMLPRADRDERDVLVGAAVASRQVRDDGQGVVGQGQRRRPGAHFFEALFWPKGFSDKIIPL